MFTEEQLETLDLIRVDYGLRKDFAKIVYYMDITVSHKSLEPFCFVYNFELMIVLSSLSGYLMNRNSAPSVSRAFMVLTGAW